MASEQTTPAGRLHRILTAVTEADRSQPTWTILADALGVDRPDQAAFYRRYSRLASLPTVIRELFRDPALVGMSTTLKRLGQVEGFLTGIHVLGVPGTQTIQVLDNAVMDGLESADAAIRSAGLGEPSLNSDEVEGLREDIEALIAEVSEDDTLDPSVRNFMLENLRRLRESLIEMSLSGVAGVQDSLYRTVGEAVSRPDVAASYSSPRMKRLWELVGRVTLLVSLASNTWQLGHSIEAMAAGQVPIHQVPVATARALPPPSGGNHHSGDAPEAEPIGDGGQR